VSSPTDITGRWYFCDDGWPGKLTLEHEEDERFSGMYYAERFDEDYAVTATVDTGADDEITLVVHDFNWLPEQRYVGHLFRHGRRAIAGRSFWQTTPYGFFANRSTRLALGSYRPGAVLPEDFAGRWNAQLDGHPATVELAWDAMAGKLRGHCTGRDFDGEYVVTGKPSTEVLHQITLTIDGPDECLILDGLLNSRPKNALCGTMLKSDLKRGFYMVRYA